ncbi:hypothetical protein [Hymenobacter sp. BT190]|uniref:hypothetical protein n=1 Tax=Hymenobacter sp. BT190 TaxID=2763505 RepID=UPI0016510468|nr:hypothetical protein [Hymenobacter sp. BT190]MBC6698415.1 hypothetical protein [Hymenobacter sp. BT190]
MGALSIPSLVRRLVRGLGYGLFQVVLVLLYLLHLTRAVGSPFRAGFRPSITAQPPVRPYLLPG